tara:strand:- start:5922 stop:6122 length:201 start_codon:yes stop_codon:yes gene_type:complete
MVGFIYITDIRDFLSVFRMQYFVLAGTIGYAFVYRQHLSANPECYPALFLMRSKTDVRMFFMSMFF